jgi:hypothetical protein
VLDLYRIIHSFYFLLYNGTMTLARSTGTILKTLHFSTFRISNTTITISCLPFHFYPFLSISLFLFHNYFYSLSYCPLFCLIWIFEDPFWLTFANTFQGRAFNDFSGILRVCSDSHSRGAFCISTSSPFSRASKSFMVRQTKSRAIRVSNYIIRNPNRHRRQSRRLKRVWPRNFALKIILNSGELENWM